MSESTPNLKGTVSGAFNRRRFLKLSGTAGGLLLSLQLLPASRSVAATSERIAPTLFVALDASGRVQLTCHRSEMGQQVRTAMIQIIADELEADWNQIDIIQATGDVKYGDQNTDGSRSVRTNFTRLRQSGAAVRQLLRQAAAERWEVAVDDCVAFNHQVTHQPTGRTAGYGELVAIAANLTLPDPESVALKDPREWRYIKQPVQSVDIDKVLEGTTTFGHDVQMDNMLVAAIARPPVVFGRLKSMDDSKARKVSGVVDIITLDSPAPPVMFKPLGGVAVLATNTWAAFKARDLLELTWEDGDNGSYNSAEFLEDLRATVRQPGNVVRHNGDATATLKSANKTLTAEYTIPHLAHAAMETPAATAVVSDDSVEIWACTQNPQAARSSVAGAMQLPEEKVTINVTLLGGGFGRKSKQDFAVEAALLAKAAKRPVKVVWSREDDIRHGYYHTVSAHHIEAAIDDSGMPTAWLQRVAFPPIFSTFIPGQTTPGPFEIGPGFIDNPFAIDNMQFEHGEAPAHVRIGWMRSVNNIHHAFAIQSFAHELAVAAEKDPAEYLLALIGPDRTLDLKALNVTLQEHGATEENYPADTARLRAVVDEVIKRSDWKRKRAAGRFLGIAAHRSFLSYVATVVEVEMQAGGLWRVPEVYVVIDAGTVVNPEHVRAQCEGGSIFGLSCALGEISVVDGKVMQSNYHDYPVARMNQAPEIIDVLVMDNLEPPAGVGEPPTPPFAPALANAIYEATGKRFRDLPLPLTIS